VRTRDSDHTPPEDLHRCRCCRAVSEANAIPVTGRGGLWGCLDSRLTDGGKGVRFEVFTALTMKNVVFWDVTPVWLL
jgi:hypothetical protein